jgi:dihydroorotase
MEKFDLVIRGGICMTPSGPIDTDVGIRDGQIVCLDTIDPGQGTEEIDATGLHVLPGVIDSQVHFREPGLEHKEDLGTGTASAALGGVTAVFEMPNTKPSTLTSEDLADKVRRGREKAWVEFAFFIGAAAENVDELARIETDEGCSGVKIFMGSSTGSLLVDDPEVLAQVLAKGKRRIAVHCEDEARLTARKPMLEAEDISVHQHPHWRDEQTAYLATQRLLTTARATGRRVHVLHVTTAEEIPLLAQYRDVATVEVTPQHLTLSAPDCYEELGSFAQMNPPIREARHREALWEALRAGVVDVIGSDHAPHTKDEKGRAYPASPSGMPGVQTLLPLMLNHVNEGRLTLQRLVDLVCHGPARIFGIAAKGRLTLGGDADITLVDLKKEHTFTHEEMASRCGWTPFAGKTVVGMPVGTIIRGNIVMQNGELVGDPIGQPVRFVETLKPVL